MIFNKDALVCPCCGDPDSYLHHDRVSVFCRQGDAETVTKTVVVNNGMAAISRVQNADSGNPNLRRDGIAIRFWCEHCGSISELTISQHKGQSLVGWRILGEVTGDLVQCA